MTDTEAALPITSVPAVSLAPPEQTTSAQIAPASANQTAQSAQAAPPAKLGQAMTPPTKTTVSPPPTPTASQSPTPPVPSAHPAATSTTVDPISPDLTEAQLEKEVEALWQDHKQAKSSARKTNKELALIRADLARALHALKDMLARPGCKGEWSSFLESHDIARATANRLVDVHQKLITPAASNSPSGTTIEPTETVVRRCLDRYWKRLSPMLATPEAVELFIGELRNRAQKSFGVDGDAPDSSVWGGAAETP